MKPELRAFKHYRKNIDYYLSLMEYFWGDDEKLFEMHTKIAEKFGADAKKLQDIIYISYLRGVERSFR